MSDHELSAFEQIPDAMLVVNRRGSIAFANRHAHRLFAYGAGELVGLPLEVLIPERYRQPHESHLQAFFAGPFVRPMGTGQELQGLRGDGHELSLEIALAPLSAGEMAVAVVRDISTRKRLQRALQTSEERYRSFVANSTEIIWCIEFDEPLPVDAPELEQVDLLYQHARIVEANDAFADAYGATVDQVIGWRLETFLPRSLPTSVPLLREAIRSSYRMVDAETVERAVDGEERVFLNNFTGTVENGALVRVWGTARDVTRLRAIERQLRLQNRELEQLRDRLAAESEYLQEEIRSSHGFEEIVGRSAALRATLHKVEQVAETDATVLLLGETGTGKELLARAIHARSRRRDRALIKIDCTTLPAGLVETELFGHDKGAFTGAHQARAGRFELANEGTIFLDEIGELDLRLQTKLLRVLEDGEFERLGSGRTRRTDVRVIAATNRDLRRAVTEGRFRGDLYYRLGVFPLESPPLRDRREDIPLLASFFVTKSSAALGRKIDSLSHSALDRLMAYDWPGNIRELQNVIERAVILSSGGPLRVEEVLGETQGAPGDAAPSLDRTLEETERRNILRALEACHWKIKGEGHAASRLGLKPSTLWSRMKRLGITRP